MTKEKYPWSTLREGILIEIGRKVEKDFSKTVIPRTLDITFTSFAVFDRANAPVIWENSDWFVNEEISNSSTVPTPEKMMDVAL